METPQGKGSHPRFLFHRYLSPLNPGKSLPGENYAQRRICQDLQTFPVTPSLIPSIPACLCRKLQVPWLCCLVSHSEAQASSLSALIFTLGEAVGLPVSRKKLSYFRKTPRMLFTLPHRPPPRDQSQDGWPMFHLKVLTLELHACPTSALERHAVPHPGPARCNPMYQGPLEGKHSCSSRLLQRLHAAAPAAAAEGICLAVLQVELPAKERGVLPALALSLCLSVLQERGGS